MGGNKGPVIVVIAVAAVLLAAVVIYKTATRSAGYGGENKAAVTAAAQHASGEPQLDNSGKRGEVPQGILRLPGNKGR